jgi:hypothetical protein
MEEVMTSLLDQAFEECVFINKVKEDDGYGGYIDTYSEGVAVECAITFNTSLEARTAEKQGVTSLYTITTKKDVILEYHDIIKRRQDGKIFRITSDGDDSATPASASLNMRVCTAEEFKLNG